MTVLQRLFGAPRPGLQAPREGDAAISVVVPLFNHARYIAAALASVFEQDAPPCDIVLIDDGSQDGGFAVAEKLLRGIADAQVLRQDNCGAPATLNRAIELCRGEFVAVLNSDDRFAPGKLALCQAQLRSAPRPSLIAGRVALIDEAGRRRESGAAAEWLRRAQDFAARTGLTQLALLYENFVATTSNMVFARALWQRLGGFAPLRYCHDLDFLMQAYAHGPVAIDVQEHVFYRVHAANTIAEEAHGVRLDLAAVIAETVFAQGVRLLPHDDAATFDAFQEFLRNKALSELVLYLLTLRGRFADRHAFYRSIAEEPQRSRLIAHLRKPAAC